MLSILSELETACNGQLGCLPFHFISLISLSHYPPHSTYWLPNNSQTCLTPYYQGLQESVCSIQIILHSLHLVASFSS